MAPAVVAGRVHQLLDPALRQVVTRAGRADCYILWRWSPHLRLKVFTVEENRIIPRRCCEGATRSPANSSTANANAVPRDKRDISIGHQCCAVATASTVVIDPGGRCHVLATVWSCAWGRASHWPMAEHGGHHGQRRQRLSAIFLFGSIRHGDCPRGRESAYLMQPLPA